MGFSYQIKAFGEAALLIEFEQRIDPSIHDQVLALDKVIRAANIEGLQYQVLAYCSLTLVFSPSVISFAQLKEEVQALIEDLGEFKQHEGSLHQIPVCYHPQYGLDLERVSQITSLSPAEIIQAHSSTIYRVYMIGFLPGFPYLGLLPPSLEVPRLERPRIRVPAGSVGLAGLQTGIYPNTAPGGWQIIGRTNVQLFNVEAKNPALLQVGDRVQFVPVDEI